MGQANGLRKRRWGGTWTPRRNGIRPRRSINPIYPTAPMMMASDHFIREDEDLRPENALFNPALCWLLIFLLYKNYLPYFQFLLKSFQSLSMIIHSQLFVIRSCPLSQLFVIRYWSTKLHVCSPPITQKA